MDSNKILQHTREKGGSVKKSIEILKMENCGKLTLEERILTLVKINQTCNFFFTQTIFMWMCESGITSDFATTSCIQSQSALSFVNVITAAATPLCPAIHTAQLEQAASTF
jgi:hypothetical protein